MGNETDVWRRIVRNLLLNHPKLEYLSLHLCTRDRYRHSCPDHKYFVAVMESILQTLFKLKNTNCSSRNLTLHIEMHSLQIDKEKKAQAIKCYIPQVIGALKAARFANYRLELVNTLTDNEMRYSRRKRQNEVNHQYYEKNDNDIIKKTMEGVGKKLMDLEWSYDFYARAMEGDNRAYQYHLILSNMKCQINGYKTRWIFK